MRSAAETSQSDDSPTFGFALKHAMMALPIEDAQQSVAEPSRHPTTFLSPIANEDLLLIISPGAIGSQRISKSPKRKYYPNGLGLGEPKSDKSAMLSPLIVSRPLLRTFLMPPIPRIQQPCGNKYVSGLDGHRLYFPRQNGHGILGFLYLVIGGMG
jgi:hypothetical protein